MSPLAGRGAAVPGSAGSARRGKEAGGQRANSQELPLNGLEKLPDPTPARCECTAREGQGGGQLGRAPRLVSPRR